MIHALRPSGFSELYVQPHEVGLAKASVLLARIFMRHGKYQSAYRFGSLSFHSLRKLYPLFHPSRLFLETIRIIRPLISFTPQRMGRIILSLPSPVKSLVSFKAAVRILFRSASKRFEKGVINRFVREIINTYQGRSGSFSAAERIGEIVIRNYHLISRFRARKYASRKFPLSRYNRGFLAYEFRRFLPRVRLSRRRSHSIFQRPLRFTRRAPFLFRAFN